METVEAAAAAAARKVLERLVAAAANHLELENAYWPLPPFHYCRCYCHEKYDHSALAVAPPNVAAAHWGEGVLSVSAVVVLGAPPAAAAVPTHLVLDKNNGWRNRRHRIQIPENSSETAAADPHLVHWW